MNRRRSFLAALTGLLPTATSQAEPAGIFYRLQTSSVRGFQYRMSQESLALIQPGDAVHLIPEPENPYDVQAVKILWSDHHIGYLPREDNAHAFSLLQQGLKLAGRITKVQPQDYGWQPLEVEIGFVL